jgi:hypothetical protein
MSEDITIGSGRDANLLRDGDPAEEKGWLAIEGVGVESPTDADAGR